MKFLTTKPNHVITLACDAGLLERRHEFDARSIAAVNAALAARRPLLVRGEPGLGKTQLAEAVAQELQRAFCPFVVDARTESRDLLWHFDSVLRLAEAQLCQALGREEQGIREQLALRNFVRPGPLWWAFDSPSAQEALTDGASPLHAGANLRNQANGWVVLIDEIDKAESDVPNGLLEALGSGQFTPSGWNVPVSIRGIPPLVIITTNEERVLPDAFLRRCLVLHLEFPSAEVEQVEFLIRRGRAHFGEQASLDVLKEAARQLIRDRSVAEREQLTPLPGQAEYLDLLRAVLSLAPDDAEQQKELLASVACFALQKHPQMRRSSGTPSP
jgi:MoxR-like ATPase